MIGVIVVVFAVLNTLTKMAFNQGMHTTGYIPSSSSEVEEEAVVISMAVVEEGYIPSSSEVEEEAVVISMPSVEEGGDAARTGSVALLAGAACWSFWFILQSRLGKKYPALYSGNALMFLLSFLQMAAVGLATERDLSVWILRTKLQIITVLFVGIMGVWN
ncbi:hypothetical protein SETIT_1G116200v2 [Setaria italica]|uniref:WAT1-related protein n=1 Tax=Setaria italica TaxID=4555 RepID=A0A368PJB2_SETIT|nr:hypothetical protein SETIT_1G116200v2 [Setaria italica]